MRLISFLLFLAGTLFCSSCSVSTTPEVVPTTEPSFLVTNIIPFSISQTHSPHPIETPTNTVINNDCDIYMGYCLLEETFFLSRPIATQNNDVIDFHYRFGSTMDGVLPPHHGVEFENPTGTPVLASYGGVIVFAGNDNQVFLCPWNNFYGNVVIIEHYTPLPELPVLYTLYGHLSKISVSNGEYVDIGETIGEVGLSGSAFGSHLHFEIRRDFLDYNSVLNPELYLTTHLDGNENRGGLAIRLISQSLEDVDTSINIQYFPYQDSSPVVSYQIHTYEDADIYQGFPIYENAAIGDLTPGNYRITLMLGGELFEKWVIVGPNKLTLTGFIVP